MHIEPLPISKKLGIRSGDAVVFVHPPADLALADLPDGATLCGTDEVPAVAADVIVAFFSSAAELAAEVPALARAITDTGALWLAWPRRAGGGVSDLTDKLVRDLGLATGLVDVKVAALGERWSSLRFVRRLADRVARPRAMAESRPPRGRGNGR